VTLCTDLAAIDAALDALATTPAAREAARNFARRLVSYGVPRVEIANIPHSGNPRTPPTETGVMLRYLGEQCLAFYMVEDDGVADFSIETRRDNGHDETLEIDPRRYGLIAAMLLART
jgi:hypothetical protein